MVDMALNAAAAAGGAAAEAVAGPVGNLPVSGWWQGRFVGAISGFVAAHPVAVTGAVVRHRPL
jgi:hypothetical protein